MSETGVKERNQKFLLQMEQERVAKLCDQTIDLRGKVPGQCFPVSLVNGTHHLDDRSLLWLKELMSQSGDEFTIGVYEQLMNRLIEARKSNDSGTKLGMRPGEESDGSVTPEIIALDQTIARKESRVIMTMSVKLEVGELSFQAATLDVSINAIKLAVKRLFCVEAGNKIAVDFEDLHAEYEEPCLLRVPYTVLQVTHNESTTHLILKRHAVCDELFVDWMEEWLQRIDNSRSKINLDDRLFIYTLERYKRLFCRNLSYPVFWYRNKSMKFMHSSARAVSAWNFHTHEDRSEGDPVGEFAGYLARQKKSIIMLVYLWNDGKNTYTFCNADCLGASLKSIVSWLKGQPEWRIVLLASKKIRSLDKAQAEELLLLGRDLDAAYGEKLLRHAATLDTLGFAVDVSSIFNNLPLGSDTSFSAPKVEPVPKQAKVDGGSFDFVVKRFEDRYKIKTAVEIELESGDKIETESVDISRQGLQVCLPPHCTVKLDQRIVVSYTLWNRLLRRVSLDMLPYRVARIVHRNNKIDVGLVLIKNQVDRAVAEFFSETIEQNAAESELCDKDRTDSFSAAVFSSLLANNTLTLPFFLGRDKDGKRIIQAVLNNKSNRGIFSQFKDSLESYDWSVLQQLAPRLSAALSALPAGEESSGGILRCGIYSYQILADSTYQWVTQTDLELKTETQKSAFIKQAMQSEKYCFFHCAITPLKSNEETHSALELQHFSSKFPHKIKAIQKKFNGLLAVGELTDVTRIFEMLYRDKSH